MSKGISESTLCEVAGIGRDTLASWIHRGVIVPPPGKPREWGVAESFAVTLFAKLLADNRSTEQAAAEAASMVSAIGEVIRLVLSDRPPHLDKIVFVTAELADGETWHRIATRDADLEMVLRAIMKRGLVRLEVRDATSTYMRTLEAFQTVRQAERVPA